MSKAQEPSTWQEANLSQLTSIGDMLDGLDSARLSFSASFDVLEGAIDLLIVGLEMAKLTVGLALDTYALALKLLGEILQLLKDLIVGMLRDAFNAGVFILPQFWSFADERLIKEALLTPLGSMSTAYRADEQRLVRTPDPVNPKLMKYTRVQGRGRASHGYDTFLKELVESFDDEGDLLRPEFSDQTQLSGIVVALAADDLFFFLRLALVLTSWFYSPDTARGIAIKISRWIDSTLQQADALGRSVDPKARAGALDLLGLIGDGATGATNFVAKLMDSLNSTPASSQKDVSFSSEHWGISTAFQDQDLSEKLHIGIQHSGKIPFAQLYPTKSDTLSDVFPGLYRSNRMRIRGAVTGEAQVYMQRFVGGVSSFTQAQEYEVGQSIGDKSIESGLGVKVPAESGRFTFDVGLETGGITGDTGVYSTGVSGSPLETGRFIGAYSETGGMPVGDDGDILYNMDTNRFMYYDSGWVSWMAANRYVFYAVESDGGLRSIKDKTVMFTARVPSSYRDNIGANSSVRIEPRATDLKLLASKLNVDGAVLSRRFPAILRSTDSSVDFTAFGSAGFGLKYDMNVTVSNPHVYTTERGDVEVRVIHNGRVMTPDLVRGDIRKDLKFDGITLQPGNNIFEVLVEGDVVTPYGLQRAYSTSRVFNIKLVGLSPMEAPLITSSTKVKVSPDINLDVKNSPLFNNSYYNLQQDDKLRSGSPGQPPLSARYKLTGLKALGTGVFGIYTDKQSGEAKAIVASLLSSENTFSHDMVLSSKVKTGRKVPQSYSFELAQYTDEVNIPALVQQFNAGQQSGLRAAIKKGVGVSRATRHNVEVSSQGVIPLSQQPDWLSGNLKSLFPVVDPIDIALQNMVDSVKEAEPDSVIDQIDDWIALQLKKMQRIKNDIEEVKRVIDLLVFINRVGGHGFYALGINNAHGAEGFKDRIRNVHTPDSLKKAKYVTGMTILLPSGLGGDKLMTSLFSKLPSAPLPGDKEPESSEDKLEGSLEDIVSRFEAIGEEYLSDFESLIEEGKEANMKSVKGLKEI